MGNIFDDLAVRYVLADDGSDTATKAAQDAVTQIETITPTRVAIGQWVSSINRWMGSKGDVGEDDDIISRARALDFLARTLELLRKDLLKPDQVKLLVGFFDSLFSSDHRAGIDASAKALRYLVTMKAFQPALGNVIIMSITKLGSDDFKRQAPATRLEIYELILQLLHLPLVAKDLSNQHGDTCGFMTALVDLCRNERDPTNLMKWFEIQRYFLQTFSPADKVAEEVFKVFSAYFPITLRASATPSGITVEDLKGAVRSCFSSHHQIARFAIPFLLNKLDHGEAVTVSVKVDILQTLEACLAQYEHVEQGVAPYADQIWTSLKYEVRNGEIHDAIEATLKAIGTLTRRLNGEDLQKFFAATWIDLSDDISNASYTESAGRLLTAIAAASGASFSLSAQHTIPHIQKTLQQSNSTAHRTDLIAVLNAILLVRLAVNEKSDAAELQDELFGDFLFESVYSPLWLDWTKSQFTTDRPPIMLKIVDGLSYLVRQKSSDGSKRALCSESTRNRVFAWFGSPSVTYPLEGKYFLLGSVQKEQDDLADAATRALANLAPLYPTGFQQLLMQFLISLNSVTDSSAISATHAGLVLSAGTRLAYIGCKTSSTEGSPIQNPVLLINTLLSGLHKVFGVSPLLWTPFINSIHLAISMTMEALAEKTLGKKFENIELPRGPAEESFLDEISSQLDNLPADSQNRANTPQRIGEMLDKLSSEVSSSCGLFLTYSLNVLGHIYRHFVSLKVEPDLVLGLNSDFDKSTEADSEISLHQLGRMATTVVRAFSEESQKKLQLDKEVFLLFSRPAAGMAKEEVFQKLVVTRKGDKDIWILCQGGCRSAPLSLGILQGLWPSVLTDLYSHGTLLDLSETLVNPNAKFSTSTRAALNTMVTVLSNRLVPSSGGNDLSDVSRIFVDAYKSVADRDGTQFPDVSTSVDVFNSALHFLAGQLANFRGSDDNSLLQLICETATTEAPNSRQLARCFEVLVSPKECLAKENHALVKRLSGQWIYRQTISPYLAKCLPIAGGPSGDEHQQASLDEQATNRSVSVFATLKHLDYKVWQSDVAQIVRVIIRSLSKFGASSDLNSVLHALLTVLDQDPDLLKSHLKSLMSNTLAVYQLTRDVASSKGTGTANMSKREAALCRKLCLQFLARLPGTQPFEPRHLLPQRPTVLRGLSHACGDPVREVRDVAIRARRAWDALS